jgi:ribosomal protein S18 acetylase RimI-like enzyme
VARRQPVDPHTVDPVIRVRRIHRRDLNRVWDFLKKVFRSVNKETVEYQRPRTKTRFLEIYEEEGIEQLLFEVHQGPLRQVVGYAECAYEVIGSDNWINERYFDNRDMRPLFVEEIAIHPGFQGRGIGSFVIEQLEHLARVHGCTHLVLEVAANNKRALQFYRARSFAQLDAAIFLAKKVISEPELLPPRTLRHNDGDDLVLDEGPLPEPAADAVETLARELPLDDVEPAPEDMSEAPAARRPRRPAPEPAAPVPAGKRSARARLAKPVPADKPARKRTAEPVPADKPARKPPAPAAPAPVDMPEGPSRKRRGSAPATGAAAPPLPPVKAKAAPRAPAPAKPRARKPSR